MRFDVELSERVVDLVEEGFDLAVRIGIVGSQNMVARRVGTSRILCCASPSYLERHGEPREPEELATHACMTYEYLPNRSVWSFRDPRGFERSVRITGPVHANNGRFLESLAARGGGHFARARLHRRPRRARRPAEADTDGLRAAAAADLRRLSQSPASVGEGAGVRRFSGRAVRRARNGESNEAIRVTRWPRRCWWRPRASPSAPPIPPRSCASHRPTSRRSTRTSTTTVRHST